MDLEPRPFAALPGLPDRDAGYREDIPGYREPKARVLPISITEYLLFLFVADTCPVILNYDDKIPTVTLLCPYTYAAHAPAMSDGIVEEV